MNKEQQDAVFTVCLMAAFADGDKSETERQQIQSVFRTLPDADLGAYQRVLLRQVSLAQVAPALSDPSHKQLAYEMAVCVCQADDSLNPREKQFLAELRQALGLSGDGTSMVHAEADVLTQTSPAMAGPAQTTPPVIGGINSTVDERGLDQTILNTAILAGALELLPESISTLAIIPVQMNLVFRVGKQYGFELGKGHVMELLATAGVGITSQVVEGFAQKLFGGIFGKVAGGLGRKLGGQVASSGLSFATTYALGHLARQYYGGGRQLSALQVKQLFSSLSQQATGLYSNYVPAIQDRARSLNPTEILRFGQGRVGQAGPGD